MCGALATAAVIAGSGTRPDASAAAVIARHPPVTAYVIGVSETVTPIRVATNTALRGIRVAAAPLAIAAAPGGRTVYVASWVSILRPRGVVTQLSTVTRRAGRPIRVGGGPLWITFTPDGRAAYVSSSSVTVINVADGKLLRVIGGGGPVAVTPDGKTAYIITGRHTITPISTATGKPGRPIRVAATPILPAIAPNGRSLYVVSDPDPNKRVRAVVTPVSLRAGVPGRPILAGVHPDAIAITPDSSTVYVVNTSSGTVTPISAAARRAEKTIPAGLPRAQ